MATPRSSVCGARCWERFDPQDQFAWSLSRAPYPGLTAFRAEDAAIFFGRDDTVQQVLGHLDASLGQGRCVGVIGASGSGKSSLVRAGVLPRLARQLDRWVVVPPFTPGERPTAALARALAAAGAGGDRAELQRRIEADPREFTEIVRDLAEGADGGPQSVLVVIDQAEELIVLSGAQERRRFLELLRRADESDVRLWVLSTLRSEFLSASLREDSLVELVQPALLVGPLGRSRLAEVILGPARRAGLEFSPGLVERMVDDTRGGDALPLLAYTLRELYDRERADRHVISAADYDAIGGVLGALRRRADRVHDYLVRSGRKEQIFSTLLRLVTVDAGGEPARRPIRREDLDEAEVEVAQAFVDARLLVSTRRADDAVVEVAHEALLRAWPPLQAAIEESRDGLRLHAELERDAREWSEAGRPDSYLLRGERLARARRLLASSVIATVNELGDRERAFYTGSEALERRERAAVTRRRRLTLAGLGLLVIVIGTAALVSFGQSRQAREQRDIAERQRRVAVSRQLAATAMTRLGSDDEQALLLALEANRASATDQAQDALRQTLQRSPVSAPLATSGPARALQFSPDGSLVVALTPRSIDGFAPASGRRRFTLATKATAVAFAPTRMITWGDTGVSVWSSADGRPQGSLHGATLSAGFVDGQPVVLQKDAADHVRMRAVPSGQVLQNLGEPDELGVEGAMLSPNGRHVVTWTYDSARVWDVAAKRWVGRKLHLPGYVQVDAGSETAVRPLFSPDGQRFALPLLSRRVAIWSLAPLRRVAIVRPNTAVLSVAFSGDGRRLAVGGLAWLELWSARRSGIVRLPHGNSITSASLSADGSRAVTVEFAGPVRLWDVRRKTVVKTIPQRDGAASVFALSPNGAITAAAGSRSGLTYHNGGARSPHCLPGRASDCPPSGLTRAVASCSPPPAAEPAASGRWPTNVSSRACRQVSLRGSATMAGRSTGSMREESPPCGTGAVSVDWPASQPRHARAHLTISALTTGACWWARKAAR
jgi:energy-coupling factor transporter ATP-binding protein EcfA2